MTKNTIRKEMAARRARLTLREREQWEENAINLLKKHPRFLCAKTIFLYHSYGAEFPTEKIAALAAEKGKRLAYPKVEGKRMRFYVGGKLVAGFKGIMEPEGGRVANPQKGDLMLLPGLAFSWEGDRLGYGGGYYDRYLSICREQPYKIGLCYPCQIEPEIPSEEHDILMDELLFKKF